MDVWVEELGPPEVEIRGERTVETWTTDIRPDRLAIAVARGEDWTPRVDHATFLWTEGEQWARYEIARSTDDALVPHATLQLASEPGWLGLPLPWCARADWTEARRGCSTFEELKAALADFAWTGPAPGREAERWWARRGAVTLAIEVSPGGGWRADRLGPNPLWYAPGDETRFDVDSGPRDPVESYPGDVDRLLVRDCRSAKQARAAVDRLVRDRGFAPMPEEGWYRRGPWVLRAAPPPSDSLLTCAIDLWAMRAGADWARGMPAFPGAVIRADRLEAVGPEADPATWTAWRDDVRLTPTGPHERPGRLAAVRDRAPLPAWLAVEPSDDWTPPSATAYRAVPSPWAFPPPERAELALGQFAVTWPHPTAVVRIDVEQGRVSRTTMPVRDTLPAPDGWAPFWLGPPQGPPDPARFHWRCLAADCDPDPMMAAQGWVREIAGYTKDGVLGRFYRRGAQGAWLYGDVGGTVYGGRIWDDVPAPRGAWTTSDSGLAAPWYRTRWGQARPITSVVPHLPADAEVAASGEAWALTRDGRAWWIDRDGQLVVQLLAHPSEIGLEALAAPWDDAPGVILAGSNDRLWLVELVGTEEEVIPALRAWLEANGWERGYGWGYGRSDEFTRGDDELGVQVDSCNAGSDVPDDFPRTCLLVGTR